MDPALIGDVASLQYQEFHVTKVLTLTGSSGCVIVDYRTDPDILRQVGERALIKIDSPVSAQFASTTAADQGYDVALVHHSRDNASQPTFLASVTGQKGSAYLTRSQAIRSTDGIVGYARNVTQLIKPDPQFGHSPRLVVYFEAFGSDQTSVARVVVHFVVKATGDETPDFA